MTQFWREGHWRTSPRGDTHWVDGHYVVRDDWNTSSAVRLARNSWLSGLTWSRAYLEEGTPNAKCPKCRAPVWFYRNPNGGCAYFDELGKPWPKHPCMDTKTVSDRTAAWQAVVVYHELYDLPALDEEVEEVQAAFNVWQSRLKEFYDREWTWQIYEAKEKRDDALDAIMELPQRITSAGVKKRRERWDMARAELNELETAYREAQREVLTAREHYIALLDRYS